MKLPVILDRAGLDELAATRPSSTIRALLGEAWARQRSVVVPALVCAEVCRTAARTRAVEAVLSRHDANSGERPAIEVVDTTFDLARSVGAILSRSRAGSEDIVDAHVVAVAARHGGGLVVTSDPDDITRLADAVPAARIIVRPAG
ncbi:MAG TPA: PIN domain-containing protein [Acidimicrobiales bacterium]|nr:PIN domain-containing protein [Acidimicrobiales bacterium]